MERTTDSKALNRDGYSKTFSIPRSIIAMPILSWTEKMIISKIVNLSSKYIDKGGCNLSNGVLARRHQCSKPVVSSAISKAKWLGMQQDRKDDIQSYVTSTGSTAIIQNRRIVLTIPELWEFFGEVWGEFYFNGCISSEVIMEWVKEELNARYDAELEFKVKKFLRKFKGDFFTDEGLCIKISKYPLLKSLRPPFEKFKTPFEKLYAFYVYGSKFTDLSFQKRSIPTKKDSYQLALESMIIRFPKKWQKNETFQSTLADYCQHRKEKQKPLTPRSITLLVNALNEFEMPSVIKAFKNTITSGWTGVFPEKNNGNEHSTKPPTPNVNVYNENIVFPEAESFQPKDGRRKV